MNDSSVRDPGEGRGEAATGGEPQPAVGDRPVTGGVAPGARSGPPTPGGTGEVPPPPAVERINRTLNIVLEGGGVKGIALVGALRALEERIQEYNNAAPRHPWKEVLSFENARYAGTSAGAVVSALLAAGYTTGEIQSIIAGPEIARFADRGGLSRIPIVGGPLDMAYGLLTKIGMYRGDYFLDFLRSKLRDKGIRTFGDLVVDPNEKENLRRRYKLYVTASDITRGRMLVLPTDINREQYGVAPDELDVALAVRMSMSVPYIFRPVKLVGENRVTTYCVDGGLLSNFPLQIFEESITGRGVLPRTRPATIGIRILRERYHDIKFPGLALRALYALASTALEAHDYRATHNAIDELKWARAIEVNTEAVSVFKWNLSAIEKEMLYSAGYSVTNRTATPEFFEDLLDVEDVIGRAIFRPEAGGGTAAPPVDLLRHLRRP